MSFQQPALRPLSAGEILDRAFRLYRANFWFFINLVGILLIPLSVLELLGLFFFQNTPFLFLAQLLQLILIGNLLNGAMACAASDAYLGRSVSIGDSYQQALRRFWSFFLANLRLGLMYLFPIVISMVVFIAMLMLSFTVRGVTDAFFFTIFFATALFVVGYIILWYVRWGLNIPVILIEGMGGRDGPTRSWSLTSKDFWHAFVVLVASALLYVLATWLPRIMVDYVVQRFEILPTIGPALSLMLAQLGYIISIPLSMSILVILYYDLRVRREGYDLELALEIAAKELDVPGEQI